MTASSMTSRLDTLLGGDNFKNIGQDELSNVQKNKGDLFIIGAGFARTGTSTLQIALARLGFKCHHMREVSKDSSGYQNKEWYKASKMKYDLKIKNNIKSFKVHNNWDKCMINYDWNRIFGDEYNGVVDFPGASFYCEFMKYYPNHKVILSVRDTPEQWYKSIMTTIYPMITIIHRSWFFNFVYWMNGTTEFTKYCIWDLLFDGRMDDKEYVCGKYMEWIDAVKEYVPKEKLLVFNVKEGYEPLCKFLGKEVIDEPLPRSNDAENMKKIVRNLRIVALVTDVLLVGVVGGLSYFAYRRYK